MVKDNKRWQTEAQQKNIAWFLPRPKPDKYKGGMPLYAEAWLLELARHLVGDQNATVLNLFCGMNQQGFRIDLNPGVQPDLICDAHELSKHLNGQKFKIILADPPYSNEESKELYNTPKLNYGRWPKEVDKVLEPEGLLIVYHKYVMPNPDPGKYCVEKRVFIGNRTYHLPRVAIFFRKKT